jgi:hypothetical protein
MFWLHLFEKVEKGGKRWKKVEKGGKRWKKVEINLFLEV